MKDKKEETFTPSPVKEVHLVDEAGNVVQIQKMNRAERRRLKLYNQKAVKGG